MNPKLMAILEKLLEVAKRIEEPKLKLKMVLLLKMLDEELFKEE